jgi:hypothetical protein
MNISGQQPTFKSNFEAEQPTSISEVGNQHFKPAFKFEVKQQPTPEASNKHLNQLFEAEQPTSV